MDSVLTARNKGPGLTRRNDPRGGCHNIYLVLLWLLLLSQAVGGEGLDPSPKSPEPERLPTPAATPLHEPSGADPSVPPSRSRSPSGTGLERTSAHPSASPSWRPVQDGPEGEEASSPPERLTDPPADSPPGRFEAPLASQPAMGLEDATPSNDGPTPPQLVAAALRPRGATGLPGEPITLRAALGSASDRARQAQGVHAYWRLVRAVALAHLAADHEARLARLEVPGQTPAVLTAARASAAAASEEARAEAVSVQHELAALVSRSPDAPLPLPADMPHVGPYLTHFHRLLAEGKAPASARVVDRRLPILWQAVEARARAAVAADRAFAAAGEAYAQGRAELAGAVETADAASAQHQALAEVVILYNRDIADYALAVAAPGAGGEALVEMLIEPGSAPLEPLPGREGSRVQPTVATDPSPSPRTARGPSAPVQPPLTPIPDPGDPAAGRLTPEVPLQAVPRDESRTPQRTDPTPTPAVRSPVPRADPGQVPTRAVRPGAAPPAPAVSSIPGTPQPAPREPTLAPEQPAPALEEPDEDSAPPDENGPASGSPAASPRPVVPIAPTLHETLLPADETEGAAPETTALPPAAAAPGLYGPLRGASPGRRAKQLALTLHWDRVLPEGIGEPLELAECLRRYGGEDRFGLVAAYWQVREEAARYQAILERSEWLDAAREQGAGGVQAGEQSPDGPRLESARLAAEAELHEAHAALVRSQFELAVRLGRSPEDVWPMAATPPHAGPYLAKLDDQPPEVAESWTVRRRAAVLPGLGEAVRQRATAVVEADAARAAAADRLVTTGPSPDALLKSIRRQADATSAFLQTLTAYNRAIAAYALSVLPPEVPADTLVAALVVR